eukprot:4094406-Prymnesium_polylepis.1
MVVTKAAAASHAAATSDGAHRSPANCGGVDGPAVSVRTASLGTRDTRAAFGADNQGIMRLLEYSLLTISPVVLIRTARGRGSAPSPGHSAHAPQAVCVLRADGTVCVTGLRGGGREQGT